MTLSEWFNHTGYRKGDFANEIGVTPQMISAYCNGDIWPSKGTMRKILRKTNGDVKADDFVWLGAEQGEAA